MLLLLPVYTDVSITHSNEWVIVTAWCSVDLLFIWAIELMFVGIECMGEGHGLFLCSFPVDWHPCFGRLCP